MIVFTVPAVPVAQPRQRHRIVATVGRQFVQNYTPTTAPVNAFKAAVQMAFAAAYQGPPLEGPIHLEAVFVLPRPKCRVWKKRPMPRERHVSKPDLDNLEKALLDALKGLAWRDDSQVAWKVTGKMVASGGEGPCVEVVVSAIKE